MFIPCGALDFAVTLLISFVCALQAQTFRRVHGLPFASTMCTGNLRSGTEALFKRFYERETPELAKAFRYYLVIACFVLGAAIGAFLLKNSGHEVILLVPAGWIAVFFLVTSKRQMVFFRRIRRQLRARI